MGTMTLQAMLFVYNPTVLWKRFGAIDLQQNPKPKLVSVFLNRLRPKTTKSNNMSG